MADDGGTRGSAMIKKQKCVRCGSELDMFGFNRDAVAFEDELLAEGIDVECGDDLCDDCANELVEREVRR